jgi:hypothetical protein
MKRTVFVAALLFLAGHWLTAGETTNQPVVADQARCDAADKVVTKARTWTDLRVFFDKYLACDDGYIAEGVSDTVVQILTHRWKSLCQLGTNDSQSTDFRAWVLGHIDATCAESDLSRVVQLASKKCPPTEGELCIAIKKAAEAALADLKEATK